MRLSVIDIGKFLPSEMLIPDIIGETKQGYCSRVRLDRALEVGHRFRGDVQ